MLGRASPELREWLVAKTGGDTVVEMLDEAADVDEAAALPRNYRPLLAALAATVRAIDGLSPEARWTVNYPPQDLARSMPHAGPFAPLDSFKSALASFAQHVAATEARQPLRSVSGRKARPRQTQSELIAALLYDHVPPQDRIAGFEMCLSDYLGRWPEDAEREFRRLIARWRVHDGEALAPGDVKRRRTK